MPVPDHPERVVRGLGRTFQSLRNRNFRLFFIGQTISNTGNWLTNVAQTLFMLRLTHGSGIAIGWLAACAFGPMMVFSPYAGVVADRYSKRTLLLWTQSLEMCQSIGLAILAFSPHPSQVAIYILATFGGILLAFDNPLRRSFVREMVPKEDIPNAVVLYSTIVNVSRIFGPALAGALALSAGFGWCFTLDAATYVAVLICLVMMRVSELHLSERPADSKGTVSEGVRYMFSEPVLWIPFVMFAVVGTLSYNFQVSLPLFVAGALHGSERTFTILYSTFSFGAVTCALIVASRSLVGMRHILAGALALGAAMLILAAAPNIALAAPAIFLTGMASILYTTPTTAIIQVQGRPGMQGRMLALQTVLMGGSTALGGPILGGISDHAGARWLMVIGGFAALVAAGFGYVMSRRTGLKETAKEIA